MWTDEASTVMVAGARLGEILARVRELELVPPLYFLLVHFWMALFPDPLAAIRVFSLLCGVAALAFYYDLCERLVPEQRTWCFALGCIASSWIHYSQDGRFYSLYLLLSLAAGRFALDLEERSSPGRWLRFVLASAAGLCTHYFFGFLLLALLARLLANARRGPQLPAAIGAVGACAAAGLLLWAFFMRGQMRGAVATNIITEPFTLRQLLSMSGEFLVDLSYFGFTVQGWVRVVGVAGLLLALYGALLSARRPLLPILFFAPLALVKVVELSCGTPMTQARYLAGLSPYYFLLAGRALGALPRRLALASKASLACVLIAGAAGYFASGRYVDPRLGFAARAIRATVDPRTVIVHLDSYNYLPMRCYYLPERAHYLIPSSARDRALRLPGYSGILPKGVLAGMGRCLVYDPARRLSPHALSEVPCRRLVDPGQ